MNELPATGSWAVDYSPSFFRYWASTNREELADWIKTMNERYPD